MTKETPQEKVGGISIEGLNKNLLPSYILEGIQDAQDGTLSVEDLRKLQERINNLQGDYSKIAEFLKLAGGVVGRAKTRTSIKEAKDALAKQFRIDAQDLEVIGENGFGGGPDIDNGVIVVYDRKRGDYALIDRAHRLVGGIWFADEPNPLSMHQVLQYGNQDYYLISRMPHHSAEKIKIRKEIDEFDWMKNQYSEDKDYFLELENGKKYIYRKNGILYELPEGHSINQIQGNHLVTKKDGKFEVFYMEVTGVLEHKGSYEAAFLYMADYIPQILIKHQNQFGFLVKDEFRSYSNQAVIYQNRKDEERNSPTKLKSLPKSEQEAIRAQMKKVGVEGDFFG